MTEERPAPMVPLPRCRVRPAVAEDLARLGERMSLPRCEVLRLVLDAGLVVVKRELNNDGGQAS